MNLKYLIENELFRTANLLNTKEFIDYCKKVDIHTKKEDLEFYEKTKVFYPIARVKLPIVTWKVKYLDGGKKIKYLGLLEKGEYWNGDRQKERANFIFSPEQARYYYENGLMWNPKEKRFLPWDHFENSNRERKYENYYSQFQIFHFFLLKSSTRIGISFHYLLSIKSDPIKFYKAERKKACNVLKSFQESYPRLSSISFLCQCLSNLYYPFTQSDMRKVSINGHVLDWDWDDYRKNWDAKEFSNHLHLKNEQIKSYHNQLASQASFIDPLQQWHDLTVFISTDKRKLLKGKALLAQCFYSMEMLLRYFYKDLTGESLQAPYYRHLTNIPYNHGVKNEKDSLPYLEYTINRYQLNPFPKLILVCEGDGEESQFKRIINKVFGYELEVLGIEIVNLKGVDKAAGRKRDNPYSALHRFVDYHHHSRNTIVYIILDNEGCAKEAKERLLKAKSIYDSNQNVTFDEYFKIWDASFEFDNFSNLEIANALTKCTNGYLFTEREVELARENRNIVKRKDVLSNLFKEKRQYELKKVEFATVLVDGLITSVENGAEMKRESERPILNVLFRIIEMASWNFRPQSKEERADLNKFWFDENNTNRLEKFKLKSR